MQNKPEITLINANEANQWANLPTELLNKIFSFLPFNNLMDAKTVCHKWYDVENDPKLYRDKLSDEFKQSIFSKITKLEFTSLLKKYNDNIASSFLGNLCEDSRKIKALKKIADYEKVKKLKDDAELDNDIVKQIQGILSSKASGHENKLTKTILNEIKTLFAERDPKLQYVKIYKKYYGFFQEYFSSKNPHIPLDTIFDWLSQKGNHQH